MLNFFLDASLNCSQYFILPPYFISCTNIREVNFIGYIFVYIYMHLELHKLFICVVFMIYIVFCNCSEDINVTDKRIFVCLAACKDVYVMQ
jgi:hypothetical protein